MIASPPPSTVSLATRITLLACALFTLLTGASISPALPAIRDAFSDEPNAELLTKLVLTVSPLFIALGGPLWGWIIDRWSRRSALLVAVICTALFGAAGALMDSLKGLIICRALLGLSVAGVTACSYTLMIDLFEGSARNRFMGLQAAVQKIGGLGFVLMGGALAAISWRATFVVDLIALLVVPGVLFALNEPPRRDPGERIADLSSLNWTTVVIVWLVGFVGQAAFFTIPTQLPFLLTEMGSTPPVIGIAIATSTLFSAAAAMLYHRIRAQLSYLAIFGLAALVLAPSFLMISQAQSIVAVIVALGLGGAGFGLLLPNMAVWIVEGVAESARGRVIGIMMTAIFLGQFTSPLLAEPFVATVGVQRMFLFVAAFLLGASLLFIASAIVQRRYRAQLGAL